MLAVVFVLGFLGVGFMMFIGVILMLSTLTLKNQEAQLALKKAKEQQTQVTKGETK